MRTGTKVLLFAGAAFAGMAIVNRRVAAAYRPLYSELEAEARAYTWRDGIVYYYVKGEGQPIVMAHDFGIAAGAYQMRPMFERLAAHYQVYALDWLGYGLSNRPAIDYTAALYEQLLADFVADVVGKPTVIIAAGPAAAFAVILAAREPDKVSHLVLIEPTGVRRLAGPPTPVQRALRLVLKAPVVGPFAFNVLSSKPALRWELRNRIFFDPSLATDELVDYQWITAHQPGARFAPISFWTGLLNLRIAEDLSTLQQPVMIVWGQQARKTPVEDIQAFKRILPSARYRAFDRCGQWPQYEAAHAFSALVHNWLRGKDKGAAAIFPGEVEPED
jgi:pimeloyl-ACP methyl ester carboxylesterase